MKRWKLKTLTASVLLFAAAAAGIWSCGSGSNVKAGSTPSAKTKIPAQQGGVDFRDEKTGIEMVFVKGGTFVMGCTEEQGDDCEDGENSEKPAHNVTVSDFYIAKYEVTQAQWRTVVGEKPSFEYDMDWEHNFKGDNFPVNWVCWDDVLEFIAKLNAMTGKNYRLPTEAEWEYAARGGVSGKGFKYAGSNDIDEVAWCDDNCGEEEIHPVGAKKPNELGIYDMSGNVREWVANWIDNYTPEAKTDPAGPSEADDERGYRVARGGYCEGSAVNCRVSSRAAYRPDYGEGIGFRLALPAHPEIH